MATEIMVVSRDMRVMPNIREVMIIRSLAPVGYCISVCSMVAADIEGPMLLSTNSVLVLFVISSFAMIKTWLRMRGFGKLRGQDYGDSLIV